MGGEQTLVELSQQFDVHANQTKQWKDQLLERATGVFGDEAKIHPPEGEQAFLCPLGRLSPRVRCRRRSTGVRIREPSKSETRPQRPSAMQIAVSSSKSNVDFLRHGGPGSWPYPESSHPESAGFTQEFFWPCRCCSYELSLRRLLQSAATELSLPVHRDFSSEYLLCEQRNHVTTNTEKALVLRRV